jgi:hypothetical protein
MTRIVKRTDRRISNSESQIFILGWLLQKGLKPNSYITTAKQRSKIRGMLKFNSWRILVCQPSTMNVDFLAFLILFSTRSMFLFIKKRYSS